MPDPNSHHPDMFRHDETVGLRLELARVKDQRDAFQAALRKEVLAIIREEIAKAIAPKMIETSYVVSPKDKWGPCC